MSDPYLFSVTNHVATFSVNDAPFNLMPVDYIDRLEEQLPDVLADDTIRAMVFTAEGLANFSAGMNLRQIPEGIKRAGSPEAFFAQRHRLLDMIENGGKPAIATFFGSVFVTPLWRRSRHPPLPKLSENTTLEVTPWPRRRPTRPWPRASPPSPRSALILRRRTWP